MNASSRLGWTADRASIPSSNGRALAGMLQSPRECRFDIREGRLSMRALDGRMTIRRYALAAVTCGGLIGGAGIALGVGGPLAAQNGPRAATLGDAAGAAGSG